MNICILTFDYPPHPVYGSGVYVDFLTRLLRESNHKVKIITVNRFGLINDSDALYGECKHIKEATRVGKCICSFGSMDCMSGLVHKIFEGFKTENYVPDVLYINGYMFFSIALKLREVYTKVKLICAIHYLVEQDNVPEDNPERKNIYDEESRMIAYSDGIICFSNLAYDLIKRRNICNLNKLYIIPHACNVEIFHRNFLNNHRFVYASRLEPGKGIEQLCEAMSRIDDNFSLDILGTGRLNQTIIQRYGKRFTFHGYKDKRFVLDRLKESDFFILPSYSEHCPMIVLEGMASGCIPILSNFGYIPEMIKHNDSGIVFDIEEDVSIFIDNIKTSIKKALEIKQKEACHMIETNYDLLQLFFAPDIMKRKTLNVFENAIKK